MKYLTYIKGNLIGSHPSRNLAELDGITTCIEHFKHDSFSVEFLNNDNIFIVWDNYYLTAQGWKIIKNNTPIDNS